MIKHIGFALGFTVLLAACGSDSSRRTPQQSPPLSVNGAAIKGPLVNANVSAYQIDPAAADLKGALLGDGETDASAQIVGLEIDSSTTGYILLEFTADADTVDLTTGAAPVLDSLVTFASMDRISADESIYATALTTLAMEIAASNAGNGGVFGGDDDGTATEAEFLSAVAVAENQVKSSLGFGLLDDVDLFATPPLLDATTADAATQAQVTSYRMATEIVVAVAASVQQNAAGNGSDASVQAVFSALAEDLADGAIDGQANGNAIETLADVTDLAGTVMQDPSLLTVPGTDIAPAEIISVLLDEVATTGTTVDTTAIEDGTVANPTIQPASIAVDSDGDSASDGFDNCPAVANEDQLDTDADGEGDGCDADDDNDTVADADDAFPLDPQESVDTDGDGTGNNADTDDDGDSVPDAQDAFPFDPTESTDTDGDGEGDNADADDDGDTIADGADNCPAVSNEDQADADGNGIGDACDNPRATWNEFNWNEADWQ